jgi:hypothetical protein
MGAGSHEKSPKSERGDPKMKSLGMNDRNDFLMGGEIKCPKCGKSHYRILTSQSTCVYHPIEVGGVANPDSDPNIYTTELECCECGEQFGLVRRSGSVAIHDMGGGPYSNLGDQTHPEYTIQGSPLGKMAKVRIEASSSTISADQNDWSCIAGGISIFNALQLCVNFDALDITAKVIVTFDGREYAFDGLDDIKEWIRKALQATPLKSKS